MFCRRWHWILIILSCDVTPCSLCLPTFRRSGLAPWMWGMHVTPKRLYISTRLYSVTFRKCVILIWGVGLEAIAHIPPIMVIISMLIYTQAHSWCRRRSRRIWAPGPPCLNSIFQMPLRTASFNINKALFVSGHLLGVPRVILMTRYNSWFYSSQCCWLERKLWNFLGKKVKFQRGGLFSSHYAIRPQLPPFVLCNCTDPISVECNCLSGFTIRCKNWNSGW